MGLMDLTVALASVGMFALARLRLPRHVLMPDGIFLGVLMFWLGAYSGAGELHYVPGALDVLHLSTVCLASTAFGAFLLPVVYKDLPSLVAPPDLLRWRNDRLLVALGSGLVLFNLGFSYLIFTRLLNSSWSTLSNENGLLWVRKMISSGEKGYFFPGLVKQLRDVLAPAYLYYLLAYTRPGTFRKMTVLVLLTTLLAVFFGGQRTPYLVLAWVVFAGCKTHQFLRSGRKLQSLTAMRGMGYLLIAVPALAGINALLGRTQAGSGLLEILWGTLQGLYERLVMVVPQSSIEAFQFVMVRDVGFAELWIADLAALMPGTQTGFSSQLHSYLGGSVQGNAVLGLPVNAYFNAGMIGVIAFPIVVMLAAAVLDRCVAKLRNPFLYSARCVMVAFLPICYDPYIFLLSGGLFFLAVLGAVVLFGSSRVDPTPRPRLEANRV